MDRLRSVREGDIMLNHHPPMETDCEDMEEDSVPKFPNTLPAPSQITTFNFSTSTKLLVRTKRISHDSCARQEKLLSSDRIPKNLPVIDHQSSRKEQVVKKAEILKLACALCQLHNTSRFGQGSFRFFPVSISPEQVFQVPNTLKEKQQFDDLAGVGHEQIKSLQHVVSEDGELVIHEKCLQWSTEYQANADGLCVNVADVVSSALLKLCTYCGHYGASIKCAAPQCTAAYHLPCSYASDCYQQLPDKKVVCSLHFPTLPDQIISNPHAKCHLCDELEAEDTGGNGIKDLMFCYSCGRHAHSSCLGFSAEVSPARKAGWQCPDCRTCCVCKGGGRSDKVVVCSDCGHDYHLTCLVPPLASLPKSAWKCPSCRICLCGKRTPGAGPSCKWHHSYTLCDSCYQQKIKGSVCPVCQKAYRFAEQRDMTKCSSCSSYTHRNCDEERADALGDYECRRCRKGITNGYSGVLATTPDHVRVPSLSTNQSAGSPSSSSAFSSSLDESSLTEQGSELSSSGGGKPPVRLKRRQIVQPGPRAGRKRTRTVTGSLDPPTGRRKGKGKLLPLIIPKPLSSPVSTVPNGDITGNGQDGDTEDDSVHTSTVVMFRNSNEFLHLQDICVSCGAIGVEDEGKLIGCAQCGQCYHSFCAGVKLSSAVLTSGWRCLDCTLCEVCGKPHDEGRLILCDECDISFHIYCLDPPLEQVPLGNWKCRRCVRCQYCDSASPGYGPSAQWHNNYSTCTPCASLQKCPVCESDYADRELVIQCLQCDRFLHASCDAIMDEDDVESAFSMGYICPFCRPENHPPLHLQHVFEDEESNECEPDVSEPKPAIMHKYDGMLLSEAGLKHIKRLNTDSTKSKSIKRKPGKVCEQNGCEPLLDNFPSLSQESDRMDDGSVDDKKKRVRRPQRFGIGGFLLRGPKPRAEKDKELMDFPSENSMESQVLSGTLSPAESLDNHLTELAGLDPTKHPNAQKLKKKKSQPKKRLMVKDTFPEYLQEAFFGKELFEEEDSDPHCVSEQLSLKINIEDSSHPKPVIVKTESNILAVTDERKQIKVEPVEPSKAVTKTATTATEAQTGEEEVDFPDLTEGFDAFLSQDPLDEDLGILDLGMLISAAEQEEDSSSQEDEPMPAQSRPTKEPETDAMADNLASILDSLENDLPQMSSEDAEDVFNTVFLAADVATAIGGSGAAASAAAALMGRMALTPASGEQHMAGWTAAAGNADSGDGMESANSNLRILQKAEQDEALGSLATISSVLFANLQQPDLKQKYPEFSERYKQILKIWRKVSTNDRQPFLQKARENRATIKASKSQKVKEDKQGVEKAVGMPIATKLPERPPTAFGITNDSFHSSTRFPPSETLGSPYYNIQEDMVYGNPTTPLSQPSTPGSSTSHAHHQQPFHVGSPAPPFSPPLERPRSVLPMQHHTNEPAYGVQSPHSYQQVQSPRTPFPPSSPFDPYAHPPASVQPMAVCQQTQEHSLLEEHDPYSQPPGTPMPQRFQQQFSHTIEPQSPQNGVQFFPRQQLRDLLNRQNQTRQRQQLPTPVGQHPHQQSPNGTFPSPQQVQKHNAVRVPMQNIAVQRQEFRQPAPPQPRMVPQNLQLTSQQRFHMPVRVPNQNAMQRSDVVQNVQYGNGQHQTYDPAAVRYQTPQWQIQQNQSQMSYGAQGTHEGIYAGTDSHLNNQSVRPEYFNRQFSGDMRIQAPQTAGFGPRNPSNMPSPVQPRPPGQWSQQQPTQPYPSMPGRPPSAMPSSVRSPLGLQAPQMVVSNGVVTSRAVEESTDISMSESERHNNMTQESWLLEHYHRLSTELSALQQDIAKVRKQRKALAARQRQMRKSNHDLSPEECLELERLTNAVSTIQKRLDTVKKDYKQHQNKMQEFTAKTGVQLIVTEPQASLPGASTMAVAPPAQHGATVHPLRPGLPQYSAPTDHPGHVGPYSPSMMSPKREDQVLQIPHNSQPFVDSVYHSPQFSPPLRPSQLQARFPQTVPSSFINQFPHLNAVQPGAELASTQFAPDAPNTSSHISPSQRPDGHTFADAVQSQGNVRPQLPSSMGLIKMHPLSPNASIRTMMPRSDIALRGGTDGRNIYYVKEPPSDTFCPISAIGTLSEMEEKSNETKNILLKQLLEHGCSAPPAVPERKNSLAPKSFTDEDEQAAVATLTPAQQQQLAMIESMPLTTRKTSLSSSPVLSISLASDTINTTTSEMGYDLEDVKKKKSQKKRKKKLSQEENGESFSAETSAETVTGLLLEQLRQSPANLFEPDKSSFPPASIFSKPETDALPIPVGKKLEDLKKPLARKAQGSFGQYELMKHGSKSRFYVGIGRISDEMVRLPAKLYSGSLFDDQIRSQTREIRNELKIKTENDFDKSVKTPASPAMSYVSTSSYGESRLLESGYDNMSDWLEIGFPPDGPSCTDIDINEPTLTAHCEPGSPASLKENHSTDMVKYELVSPDRSGKLLKDSDRVNVTMTISDEAASNMEYFLQGLADLLRIPVNEIEMISSEIEPEFPSLQKDIKSFKYCRTCEIVLSHKAGFRKRLSEFPFTSLVDNGFPLDMENGVAYVSFCSSECMLQFAINNQTGTKVSPPATVSVDHGIDGASKTEPKKEKREPPKRFTSVQLMLKSIAPLLRKGKKARHELWTPSLLQVKRQNRVLDSLTSEQILNLLDVGLKVRPEVRDTRVCVLCHLIGDFLTDGPGRLLNIDGDQWVHLNCALWSTEVYETINGHLMNVQPACKRGAKTECLKCRKYGATLVCYKYPTKVRCNQVLHFPCAKNSGCMFFNDKSVLCEIHKPGESPEDELKTMAVHRRVYVHRDESRLASRVIGARDGMYTFRIGTLIFHSLGQLFHPNVDAFHNKDCVYPVGYSVTRIFWSMRAVHKRCFYHCTIQEVSGIPDFRITVEERGYDNILLSGSTSKEVWMKVLTAVLEHRSSTMIKVFPDFFSGDDLFGLTESNIAKAIECLPGINEAIRYQFKFEKPRLPESPVVASAVHNHRSGSARTEPKLKPMSKRGEPGHHPTIRAHSAAHFSLTQIPSLGALSSAPLSVENISNAQDNGTGLTYYQRQMLSHTKINQYRRMKSEWRTNVYLARSKIEGLGLFAARDLDKNSMVIEYVGELIRNEVADHRERMYDIMNRDGIYMFRVDQDEVCDASRAGGPARFINHSCDPNCVTEIVQTDRNEKKIVISTVKRIRKDEELCYDYKFDFEDDQHKIVCNCGAQNCKRWMN